MNFRKIIQTLLVVLSLVIVGSALFAFSKGYRAFFVSTPSMGMTAPVGTLIITYPAKQYHQQDIIAFKQQDRVYTHRIVGERDGGFVTKGDLNASDDNWIVQSGQIIGRAVVVAKHLGWIWKALPAFILGMTIVWLISNFHKLNPYWRWPIRLIGLSVVVTIITIWLRPWVSFAVLGVMPRTDHAVDMRIVNTGVFRLKAQELKLVSGEDGITKVSQLDDKGRFILVPRPSLSVPEIIFAVLFCLIPLFISLVVEVPPTNANQRRGSKTATRRQIIAVLIIGGTVVLLVMQFSSLASIIASIKNQPNRVRTAHHFTCKSAMQHGLPRPIAAYGMNQRTSWWSPRTETDLSPNNRSGEYKIDSASYSSNFTNTSACKRDNPARALNFNSDQCLAIPTQHRYQDLNNFSLEAWFRTDRRGDNNGKIIGFGDTKFENNGANDRHVYIDKIGRVVFGTYRNQVFTLASPPGTNYADNQWHHVVATFSTTSGSKLYLDGQEVASNPNMRQAQDYDGYWRLGCGKLLGWRNADGSPLEGKSYFHGNLQFGAVYHTILNAEQVKDRFIAGN